MAIAIAIFPEKIYILKFLDNYNYIAIIRKY